MAMRRRDRSTPQRLALLLLTFFITSVEAFQPCRVASWSHDVNRKSGERRTTRFGPPTTTTHNNRVVEKLSSPTSLHALLDVPEGFFTITFSTLGLLLAISKNFARIRMEENAWEQRLAEARRQRLEEDPTVTELDLRRKEAAMEWSAYGKPAAEQRERERREKELYENDGGRYRRRGGVKVMRRDDDYAEDDDDYDDRRYSMTDDEISAFELEYGIDYDPYYDDPYTEDELPMEEKYTVDKIYGDRIYENGEVFYKDKASGLYYRQGAKPRNLSFWS